MPVPLANYREGWSPSWFHLFRFSSRSSGRMKCVKVAALLLLACVYYALSIGALHREVLDPFLNFVSTDSTQQHTEKGDVLGNSSGNNNSSWVLQSSLSREDAPLLPIEATTAAPHPPLLWRDNNTNLPAWVIEYLEWHHQQRESMRQEKNNGEMKFLVLQCMSATRAPCGGLSDRIQSIPFVLYAGYKFKRVVLIRWDRPYPLESFFEPPPGGLDWRVPEWLYPHIPERTNFREFERFLSNESLSSSLMERFLTCKLQIHDGARNHLIQAGGGDFTGWYSTLFHMLFVPTPPIEKRIRERMDGMGLSPGQYAAVHIRAKYKKPDPELQAKKIRGELRKVDFSGKTKQALSAEAENAVTCAASATPGSPVYIASDSNDIVRYVIRDSNVAKTSSVRVVGRDDVTEEEDPVHIEFAGNNRNVTEFYSIFEDLYLLGRSRCVSYGVGGYGRFASLISYNVSCGVMHKRTECPWPI